MTTSCRKNLDFNWIFFSPLFQPSLGLSIFGYYNCTQILSRCNWSPGKTERYKCLLRCSKNDNLFWIVVFYALARCLLKNKVHMYMVDEKTPGQRRQLKKVYHFWSFLFCQGFRIVFSMKQFFPLYLSLILISLILSIFLTKLTLAQLTEVFKNTTYFLFLQILNEKENKEASNLCFELRISRKRKYNFWRNGSFKTSVKMMITTGLLSKFYFDFVLISSW